MLLTKPLSKSDKQRYLLSGLHAKCPVPEQYRTLRTNIQLAMEEKQLKSLIITSAASKEGKSATAANLSIAFAETGKKVLLIDANLRKPAIHLYFQMNNSVGFSTMLDNEASPDQCITSSGMDNLDILPGGRIPFHPSALLFSRRIDRLMDFAAKKYDLILLDTPEALVFNDAQILANKCDGVLLVAKNRKTKPEKAEEVRNLFSATKAVFLGAVLNDL